VAAASGSGTPTGSVSFLDGTTTLGTATLSSGAASYSTSSLAAGSHSITAVYAGDTNFSGSTSNAVTVTVQAVAQSFAIAASPASGTASSGGSVQTTITVTPAGGFSQAVSFTCSGLPTGGTCTFSPATVTPNGAAATTSLTISAGSSSQLARPPGPNSRPDPRGAATLALLAGGAWWFALRRKRTGQWSRLQICLLLLLTALATTVGCGGGGGGGGTQGSGGSTTYPVTITATAGTQTQTAAYSLTVQ
jgi:hypothetical protein